MTNSIENSGYYRYWGKARRAQGEKGSDYHLLVYHSLDVAAVGSHLLAADRPLASSLARFLDLSPLVLQQLFTFFLTLHDLGKFASAFQALYSNGGSQLLETKSRMPYDGRNFRHDMLGSYFWQHFVRDDLVNQPFLADVDGREKRAAVKSLRIILDCVLGHHGKPIKHDKLVKLEQFTEAHNLASATTYLETMIQMLCPDLPVQQLIDKNWRRRLEQVSWHLAGLAVLADWIGSNNDFFEYESDVLDLHEYWQRTLVTAATALSATDLTKKIQVKPFQSIFSHYGFAATPLQKWVETVDIDNSPQLFILEDITGSGKTEAALALTHRLMEVDAADGFYFGLPTMATSNAMFRRVTESYLQMVSLEDGVPSIVLAHGSRDMNKRFRDVRLAEGGGDINYNLHDETATAQCNAWLGDSSKKALLAPVGIGTVDQALVSVLPRRHQSLRLMGLHRKVLIFDEVHAADEFMFELLESLLALHLRQGGSAILLTATLSQKQRRRLCRIWQEAGGLVPILPVQQDFPLVTKVSLSVDTPVVEVAVASGANSAREVKVEFLHSLEGCIEKVLAAVANGQCVVWIRNSVDDALQAFLKVKELMNQPDDCILFHSRFVLQDRMNIENKVMDVFGKKSASDDRAGKVLIATQVFQESLDVDTDTMISDICLIDDLIQRVGRLHRHKRDENGSCQPETVDTRSSPVVFVHAPEWTDKPDSDWLSKNFRNTQYVYRSPGRLWLGMKILKELGAIRMPDDARTLIETVYGDDVLDQVPEALLYQENELIGAERSKAAKAKNQLIDWAYGYCDKSAAAWHEDDSEVSTRYSDIETVEVLLVREVSSGELLPWLGEVPFAVRLSTVKVSKNKYASRLRPLPDDLIDAEQRLKGRFKQAKYLQCWLVDRDPDFSYESSTGFSEEKMVTAI